MITLPLKPKNYQAYWKSKTIPHLTYDTVTPEYDVIRHNYDVICHNYDVMTHSYILHILDNNS